MAEQYTEVINLFKIETVVATPFTSGPKNSLKLNMIRYLDGQIRVDGQFFVPSAAVVGDQAVICNFNLFNNEQLTKFLSVDFYDSFLMMSLFAESGGKSAQLNAALFRADQKLITYNFSSLAQDVLEDAAWTLQGVLVPRDISPTSSLLWSK